MVRPEWALALHRRGGFYGKREALELRQLWCHEKQQQETLLVATSDGRGETEAEGQAIVRNERR